MVIKHYIYIYEWEVGLRVCVGGGGGGGERGVGAMRRSGEIISTVIFMYHDHSSSGKVT